MEEVEKLKQVIIDQAKYYLKEFDEFFPFGAIINKQQELKPTSLYVEEEQPTSSEVIKDFEEVYLAGIQKGEYKGVGLGVDVRVQPPNMNERLDAIEIRIDHQNYGSVNFYIPYRKLENGSYKFYEEYKDKGTLNLYKS